MKKILFIFNPVSGRAKIRSLLGEIVDFYTNNDYLISIYPTQKRGDAYSLIASLDMSYDLLVCSGGDGTLNEIISGILNHGKNMLLGYIPSGSTNDFGKSMGIPSDLLPAMEVTLYGKRYRVDIGRFNENYFVYIAAFGIFTNIPYSTPQKIKNAIGYLAYVLAGIKALSELKSYSLLVEYQEQTIEGEFIIGLIMNSFSIAGFKNPVYSLTELNDGLFEMILIRMPQNIGDLQEIITSLLNESIDSELIVYIQASNMEIRSELIEWTLDGEYGGKHERVSITNLNQAIDILVPIE
ncbi:YegS/Rv2252/BmrU family lipid kinase [Lachnospiraceae bacterium 62-35]